LIDSIINSLTGTLPPEAIVFIISMLPILELRAGLIAAYALDINILVAFPICVLGNILPVPFLLLFIRKIIVLLRRFPALDKFAQKLQAMGDSRKKRVGRYTFIGLILFVGIPLPGTGAWTGALAADALDMRFKRSFPAILIGIIMAGIIISLASYGLLDAILDLIRT